MRKINFPLLLGSIIVIFLIILSFYPRLFTHKDPLFEESNKNIEYKENGKWVEKIAHNPMPPNRDNILGTDDAGRDVYARIIYGTRNTLTLGLLIALFRMALALPLGIAAGMGMKFVSGIIRIFNTFFTAIPTLLFSFVVLNMTYFRILQMDRAILAFAIVLTITGWAKLAGMIEDSTRRVMEKDFIEGEVATGKTKLQIAYQNILPHIIPDSISLFFKEMGMALFLIAQLAVLYVFVGVSRKVKELAFKASYEMILEPEWGGALSRVAVNLKKYNSEYWMLLYPVLAFSIAILGINLTGEGLRIEFQKRESRIISFIREAFFLVSPRIFISQLKDFKKYYKPVIAKSLVVASIAAYIIVPWNPSHYDFDLQRAKLQLEELTSSKYEGRATGTRGGYMAGEYIINTLKEYGYQVDTMEVPLNNIKETIPPTMGVFVGSKNTLMPQIIAPMVIESGWIKLKDSGGVEKTYNLHKDFVISTLSLNMLEAMQDKPQGEFRFIGAVVEPKDALSVPEGMEYIPMLRDFSWISFYNLGYQNNIQIDSKGTLNRDIKFVLYEGYDTDTNTYLYDNTTILPFEELRMELEKGYRELEICFDYPKLHEYNGRNITAFLPGKGKTKENPGEVIIIGASYDGVYLNEGEESKVMTAAPAAIALEVARVLSQTSEPLEKSIMFILWDNESDGVKYSSIDGSYYYSKVVKMPVKMAMSHKYYYFDIGYPGFTNEKELNLITFPAQRADASNYLMGIEIEGRLKEMNAKFRRHHYDYNASKATENMRLNALSTVEIGYSSSFGINGSLDKMENINYKGMKNIGQVIIDTMTMNPYVMKH